MNIIKKIAIITAITSLLSSGSITSAATKYTDEDLNRTKWSEIDYTKILSGLQKPSDRIQINNLFTKYKKHPLDFNFNEDSLIDGYQKSYWQISWLKETARIIASDLDPDDESLRNIFGWSKADLYDRLLMSAKYDISSYSNNWGMQGIFNNVYDIFDNNQRITDKIFAHFKASKLRADLAKNELIKLNGQLTHEQEHSYEEVVKQYEIIELAYNGQFDKNYLPKVVIDDGFKMPPGMIEKMNSALLKMPHKLRLMIHEIRFMNNDNKHKIYGASDIALGRAGGDKFIEIYQNWTNSSDDMLDVLLHEIGHVVDYNGMMFNEKGEYIDFISTQPDFKTIHKEEYDHLPAYYRDAIAEGFAEGFGRWLHYKYVDSNSHEWYQLSHKTRQYFEDKAKVLFNELNNEIKIEAETLNYSTEYIGNTRLNTGMTRVKQEGKTGYTEYRIVNGKKEIIKTVEPVNKIVEIGAKPIQTTLTIPFSKEKMYITQGNSRILKKGENGQMDVTLTFDVDKNTGKVTRNIKTQILKYPIHQMEFVRK